LELLPSTMSRSALWHQRGNVKGREEKAIEIFDNAIEEGRQNSYLKGVIPLSGPDDTFNIHPVSAVCMFVHMIWYYLIIQYP